jgi:hypothetical protein
MRATHWPAAIPPEVTLRSALLAILAPLAFIAACGDNSVQGPSGASGADGMDGSTTLVSTSTEPAGANCAAGGVRIDVGLDDNGNGTLDAGEIDHTSYVCSGQATAHDSLVSVTPEPAGANCADGGQRIDYGVDDNDSGVLDVGEIDGTSYVCDSAAGSDGRPNLLAVTAEPAGANCTSGGQRIDYGIDDDGNGTLDAAEIDGTTYVCNGGNGQDGQRSLIAVTAEPAGANCATGGQRVEYGIDDDGNGTLDAAEVDGTTYVCNGADGTTPPQSLLSVTAEPAGANCATGGQRIDHGIDDDGNGTLDAAEIDGTTFICNGADGNTGPQSLVAVTPETAGLNCATGGQRIDYGVDDDADGTLDALEIDGTTYVCNGTDGTAGDNGLQSLLAVTPEPAGANCANGGQRIDYGIDDNGNGTLEAGEIDGTAYACDGANGFNGLQSLVTTTPEPAGVNCADGGQRVDHGLDDNSNGTLDAAEVDGTTYVCNGADGTTPPQSLVSVTAEPAGANCATGGQRIDHGIDDNGNGTLDATEVDGTTFICNGANGSTGQTGAQSLVAVTAETAGANCATGGQRIDYGIDDDADGTLDAAEIDGTTYVCDGTAGDNGLQSLLAVTPEPAGANCANGGQRIDYGIDDNGNGTLDAGEIDGTAYACDGANGGNGLQTLVTTTHEPSGANCAAGGQRIDYGIDDNSNGTLDAGEVDGTAYACNGAGPPTPIVNGSFETGDYAGWTLWTENPTDRSTFGIASSGQTISANSTLFDFLINANVPESSIGLPLTVTATDGTNVAVELQGGVTHRRMYQDVTLPSDASVLEWDMRYNNHFGTFDDSNQYLAINVRDPGSDAILGTIYKTTSPQDPGSLATMTAFTAPISAFAGLRVRIDVEMVVRFNYFDMVLDNFRWE